MLRDNEKTKNAKISQKESQDAVMLSFRIYGPVM